MLAAAMVGERISNDTTQRKESLARVRTKVPFVSVPRLVSVFLAVLARVALEYIALCGACPKPEDGQAHWPAVRRLDGTHRVRRSRPHVVAAEHHGRSRDRAARASDGGSVRRSIPSGSHRSAVADAVAGVLTHGRGRPAFDLPIFADGADGEARQWAGDGERRGEVARRGWCAGSGWN